MEVQKSKKRIAVDWLLGSSSKAAKSSTSDASTQTEHASGATVSNTSEVDDLASARDELDKERAAWQNQMHRRLASILDKERQLEARLKAIADRTDDTLVRVNILKVLDGSEIRSYKWLSKQYSPAPGRWYMGPTDYDLQIFYRHLENYVATAERIHQPDDVAAGLLNDIKEVLRYREGTSEQKAALNYFHTNRFEALKEWCRSLRN